jgi:hypothetical protein
VYFPFVRAVEYLRVNFDTKLSQDEFAEFRKEVEALKVKDTFKSGNMNGVIDGDLLMTKVIKKFRLLVMRTKSFVINAFEACDLDGNGQLSLNEFIMLVRHIEPKKFDMKQNVMKFYDWADLKEDGEGDNDEEKTGVKNMSFDNFALICNELNMFSEEAQMAFLGIESVNELKEQVETLKSQWVLVQEEMRQKIESLCFEGKELENWMEILQTLGQKVTSADTETRESARSPRSLRSPRNLPTKQSNFMPLMIAYKMLKEELARLISEDNEDDESLDAEKND